MAKLKESVTKIKIIEKGEEKPGTAKFSYYEKEDSGKHAVKVKIEKEKE